MNSKTNRWLLLIVFLLPTLTNISAQPAELKCVKILVPENAELPQAVEVAMPINPTSTVLVVIDFWENVAPYRYINNTLDLIKFAHRQNIPVIHIPHENPVHPLAETATSDVILEGYKTVVESYFAKKGWEIKTVLFAGYHAAECVQFTRLNSLTRLAARRQDLDVIVVKDCTWTGYWQYLWAMNGYETRFQSTSLQNLKTAFGETDIGRTKGSSFNYFEKGDERFESPYFSEYKAKYKHIDQLVGARKNSASSREEFSSFFDYNLNFGKNESWNSTALVVINPIDLTRDKSWQARARENSAKKVQPLITTLRKKNIEVIFFAESDSLDKNITILPDDKLFAEYKNLYKYLADRGITTIIFAGNFTNSTTYFNPVDPWRFTVLNTGFNVVFVEDCIITDEIEETLPDQIFKLTFLERSIFNKPKYSVTTTEIIAQNLSEITFNEVYANKSKRQAWVEFTNNGQFPINLNWFTIGHSRQNIFDGIALPSYQLAPGDYFTVEFSEATQDIKNAILYRPYSDLEPSTGVFTIWNIKNEELVDEVEYNADADSKGKFPNGGETMLSFDSPTQGSSNYFVFQNKFLCEGQESMLVVNGSQELKYKWHAVNNILQNDTSKSIAVRDADSTKVVLSVAGVGVDSLFYAIVKHDLPSVTVEKIGPTDFCNSNLPSLQTDAIESITYSWFRDDSFVQDGHTITIDTTGVYYLVAESPFQCKNQSISYEFILHSGDDFYCDRELLTISPNPNDGRFDVNLKSSVLAKEFRLFNAIGKTVSIEKPQIVTTESGALIYAFAIDAKVPNGVYTMSLISNMGTLFSRIVINR